MSACVTTSVRRSPTRSATGPSTSVPNAPASSIRKSNRLPAAFECPSDTTQRGTNASNVNQATLRKAMTNPSSAIAYRRSSPRRRASMPAAGLRTESCGATRTSTSAMARTGAIAISPPTSPSQTTSCPVTNAPRA